jgi:hypothetical protein
MATFMAAHHGDFTVLTYNKKKAKKSIDNSSHGLISLGALLITFVLATLLRLAVGGPCGRAACDCLLPFWTPHVVCPMPYAPRRTPHAICPTPYAPRRMPHNLHRMPHAVRPTPYAPCRTPHAYAPRRTPHDLQCMPHAVCPTSYAPRRTLSAIR